MMQDNNLDYLLLISPSNQPLLFKSYRSSTQDLNIQLHCYASLDFLDEKLSSKGTQYLGPVYNIFNLTGQYVIHAFYTVTKLKILGVFRLRGNQTLDQEKVKSYFLKVYKLYKKELYQPFDNMIAENKFSKKFHLLLDTCSKTSVFK